MNLVFFFQFQLSTLNLLEIKLRNFFYLLNDLGYGDLGYGFNMCYQYFLK